MCPVLVSPKWTDLVSPMCTDLSPVLVTMRPSKFYLVTSESTQNLETHNTYQMLHHTMQLVLKKVFCTDLWEIF